MEILIVLVFLAIPVIALFKAKQKVDVKFQPLPPRDAEDEQDRNSSPKEGTSLLRAKEKPAAAKSAGNSKTVSKPEQPAVSAVEEPREAKPFTLSDEEKKKMIIYSEILKPKYEE